MPFTCPKWECREQIPFSSKALACPTCGTHLFLDRPVRQPEPDEEGSVKTRKKKRTQAPKTVEPYSRNFKPLNDEEIQRLIKEENEEADRLYDSYYRELQF